MAMYKINTNQTLVPFSKLEAPPAREVQILDGDDDHDEELPEDALSEHAHEQPHDSRAVHENIIITGGPIAKLLDGPVFAPTAFSARFVGGPDVSDSPPRQSTEKGLGRQLTPAASPTRPCARDEKDLTSSVVKGHAASGLLELAHSK